MKQYTYYIYREFIKGKNKGKLVPIGVGGMTHSEAVKFKWACEWGKQDYLIHIAKDGQPMRSTKEN